MNKDIPVGLKILRGIGAFLLCLALFFTSISAMLVAEVRIATDKNNLQKIITRSLFSVSTLRRPAADAVRGDAPRLGLTRVPRLSPSRLAETTGAEDPSSFVVEWLYNAAQEQFGGELDISLETVKDFVDNSTLKDFLAEKSASIISDFVTGENTTTITAEEIKTQLEQNAQLIEDCFGFEMTEDVISGITEVVTENEYFEQIQEDGIAGVILGDLSSGNENIGNGDIGNEGSGNENIGNEGSSPLPSPGTNPLSQVTAILDTARSATSAATLLTLVGICVVIIALLCLMYLKQLYIPMRKVGITLLFASLPLLIPTALVLSDPSLLMSLFSGADATGVLVGKICREILSVTAPLSITVAAVSFALIVGSIVLQVILKKMAPVEE